MGSSFDDRLRRYALLSVPQTVLLVLLVLGALPAGVGVALVLVASVPLVWSWGPYQAHLGMNGALDETERQRWRIGFYLVPASMAAYWLRYVRGD